MNPTIQAKTYPRGSNLFGLPQKDGGSAGGFNQILSVEDIIVNLAAGATATYTITSQFTEFTQLDIQFIPTTKGLGGALKIIPSPTGTGDYSQYSTVNNAASAVGVVINSNKSVTVQSNGSTTLPVVGILRIIVTNRKLKNYFFQAIPLGTSFITLPFSISDPKKAWLAPLSNFDGAFGIWVNSYLPQETFPNIFHFTFGVNTSFATKVIDANRILYSTGSTYNLQLIEFY